MAVQEKECPVASPSLSRLSALRASPTLSISRVSSPRPTLTIFWKSLPPPHAPFHLHAPRDSCASRRTRSLAPRGGGHDPESSGAFRGENRDVLHHPTKVPPFSVIYVPSGSPLAPRFPDTPWGMPRDTDAPRSTSKERRAWDQNDHVDLFVAEAVFQGTHSSSC